MSGSVSLDYFVKVLSGGLIVTDALLELRNRTVQEAQRGLAAEIGRLTKVGLHSEELSHVADELEQARQSAMQKGDNGTKADALDRVKVAGQKVVGDARKKVDTYLADHQSYLDGQKKARAAIEAAQGAVEQITHSPSQQKLDGNLQSLQQLFIRLSSTKDAGLLRNHARELESCRVEAGRLAAAAAAAATLPAGRDGAPQPPRVNVLGPDPGAAGAATLPPADAGESKPPRGTVLGGPDPGAATAEAASLPAADAGESKPPRGTVLGEPGPGAAAAPPPSPAAEAEPPPAPPVDVATPTPPPRTPEMQPPPSPPEDAPPKSLAQRLRDDPHAGKAELLNRGLEQHKFDSRHFAASAQAVAVGEDISDLSEAEVVALHSYTTEDYTNMNRVEMNKRKEPGKKIPLLERDPHSGRLCEKRPEVLEALNEITKIALKKLPELGTITSSRGEIAWDGWEEVYAKGGTFKCQGFWSTSTASPFDLKLHITITGHGGKSVAHLSQFAPEAEVLYPPDTEFRVLDRQDQRDPADGSLIKSVIVVVEV